MHMRVRIQRIIITEILTHRLAFFSLSLSRERKAHSPCWLFIAVCVERVGSG